MSDTVQGAECSQLAVTEISRDREAPLTKEVAMAGTAFAGVPTTQFGQLSPAPYGAYGYGANPFGMQASPYSQPFAQSPFGYGGASPFGTQSQPTFQHLQSLHVIPQQLQQLLYLQQHIALQLQQLSQIVPHQLHQVQQLLQLLPQQIQQLQQQLLWQSSGIQPLTGLSPFSSAQTGAPWTWSTMTQSLIPAQGAIMGQPGIGPQTFAAQTSPVM
jgi:hypothetical protein